MSDPRDQKEFWTDKVGPIWVNERAATDALFRKILARTLENAELCEGQIVFDIGCGAGTSTMTVAENVGDGGHVTGLDISRTLLDAARQRSADYPNLTYLEADAETHSFAAQNADAIISRFGVMFFNNPVTAFRNLNSALRPAGVMSFSCWGEISANPFFTLPAQTARMMFGPTPKSDPDGPGPFSLRDPDRIVSLLAAAGVEAQVTVVDETLETSEDPVALARTMCRIGPAHSALLHHKATEKQTEDLVDALADNLRAYRTDHNVQIPAQINYVIARKSA